MGKIDFDGINESALANYPGLLEEWLPGGKKEGPEYLSTNPTRADSKAGSFSINVNSGKWGDFATGDSGGDPISLYAYLFSMSQGEAAKALAERLGMDSGRPAPRRGTKRPKNETTGKKSTTIWTAILPVPDDAPDPPLKHYRLGEPSARWPYLDGDGLLFGFVCRFDKPDGGKEVVPLVFASSDNGRREWRWQSFDKPRPLYGLDRLAAQTRANVIIVEGEKCADALQVLLPEVVVVSWPGGGKAVKHAHFVPVFGRKVVIWPDNDGPGLATAQEIAGILAEPCPDLRLLRTPEDKPKGWDVADAIAEGWDRRQVLDYLKNNLIDPEPGTAPPPEEPPDPAEGNDEPDDYDPDGPAYFVDLGAPTTPFLALGYDHGCYYYLPRGTRQVVELRADGHAQKNLLTLAPLQWWERAYPGRSGASWSTAANALFRYGESRGVYDPRKIRGRGAWEDDGRRVLHLGDHLNVNGRRVSLADYEGGYIYEAAAPIDQGVDAKPLPAKSSVQLVELCDMLSWERPISAKLLAGWCVVAPICGALTWRPHIWVTGGAGTGKSWVVDNLLRPALGPAALMVQSNTTEAGLRQELKHDARPVLFDEAEGEDKAAQNRIQNVLELMRQASTESGAAILKGSANGKAMAFRIRSSFAFSSIGVNLQQHADASRVTVLSLVKPDLPNEIRAEQFEALKRAWAEIMTPEFCAGLRARAVSLIPAIRANAGTFGRAAAEHLGSQRIGDQVGALLAGCYALFKSSEVTLEQAREWVQQQDWGEIVQFDETRDELRCLAKILEAVVKVEGENANHELSIGEAIEAARHPLRIHDDIPSGKVEAALRRIGIRTECEGPVFAVSNSHNGIKAILRDTPWANNWPRILARVDGAVAGGLVRFASTVSRCVEIPVDILEAHNLGGD